MDHDLVERFGEPSTLDLSRTDDVLVVTLARPERLNAMSTAMLIELREVFLRLGERLGAGLEGARPPMRFDGVVLIGAGGRAFAAGAELDELRGLDRAGGVALGRLAHATMAAIESCPLAVIACVDGHALGGGLELALACDWIVTTRNARLGQPETALGLIPGFGGCVRLPERVGLAKARELILTGRAVDGQEAVRIGLASAAFETRASALEHAVHQLAEVGGRPAAATALAKRTLARTGRLGFGLALEAEAGAYGEAFALPEAVAGIAAFLDRSARRDVRRSAPPEVGTAP